MKKQYCYRLPDRRLDYHLILYCQKVMFFLTITILYDFILIGASLKVSDQCIYRCFNYLLIRIDFHTTDFTISSMGGYCIYAQIFCI